MQIFGGHLEMFVGGEPARNASTHSEQKLSLSSTSKRHLQNGQQKSFRRKRQCWYSLSENQLTEIATELNCRSPVDNQTYMVIGLMKNYLRKARMFERVVSRITFFLKRASLNNKKSFLPPAFMRLPRISFMIYNRNIK